MATEKIIPWVLFLPILITLIYYAHVGDESIPTTLIAIGVAGWILFLCMSFFTGMASLIAPKKFEGYEDFRRLVAGMNLWVLILGVYFLDNGPLLSLTIIAHVFNFALHFFQTSIFQKAES